MTNYRFAKNSLCLWPLKAIFAHIEMLINFYSFHPRLKIYIGKTSHVYPRYLHKGRGRGEEFQEFPVPAYIQGQQRDWGDCTSFPFHFCLHAHTHTRKMLSIYRRAWPILFILGKYTGSAEMHHEVNSIGVRFSTSMATLIKK